FHFVCGPSRCIGSCCSSTFGGLVGGIECAIEDDRRRPGYQRKIGHIGQRSFQPSSPPSSSYFSNGLGVCSVRNKNLSRRSLQCRCTTRLRSQATHRILTQTTCR